MWFSQLEVFAMLSFLTYLVYYKIDIRFGFFLLGLGQVLTENNFSENQNQAWELNKHSCTNLSGDERSGETRV